MMSSAKDGVKNRYLKCEQINCKVDYKGCETVHKMTLLFKIKVNIYSVVTSKHSTQIRDRSYEYK
jgi:hypothetical protein